ncbi:MAG: phage holin family protein [Pseudomonadota bacterium]|nr:phage holin family protein [Pseudomonadota bacterium]
MIIHPLLRLIATKPHLLGDHVEAYSELIGAEVQKTSKMWVSRAVFGVAAVVLLLAGLLFTGIALMLWAVVPGDSMNSPWLLIAVPLVPIAAGAFCIFRAKAEPAESAFGTVKEQFNADLAMLREVSAAS